MIAADPDRALAGRREAALLELPSVRRMGEVLAATTREPSWVRMLVAGLDRFRRLTGADLEALLERARAGPEVAERALAGFALELDGHPDSAVAALAAGPKVWFRLGGVPVAWRPLPARALVAPLATAADPTARLVLLAMVGSGLHVAELLRLRVGELGSLDADGSLVPDPEAEPLAVRFTRLRDRGGQRITFLSYHARAALLADLHRRRLAGLDAGAGAPLVAGPDGRRPSRASVASARRRANAVIRSSSALNVELCRTTGEFFRTWGLPGSRFVPVKPSGQPIKPSGQPPGSRFVPVPEDG
jgi:hypothetical protein